MQLAGVSLDSPFIFAPLAGVTRMPVRLLARRGGAALVYTEMISATGLALNQPQTRRLARIWPGENPVALQLFGADPACMRNAAAAARELGADLLDVNLGCPARRVRRQGAGSALLDNPALAAEVVAAAAAGWGAPVTVKLRLGYDRDELMEIVPGLVAAGAAAVCLHARTTKQGFAGRADWGTSPGSNLGARCRWLATAT
jgi:tRNA-dihydrouridine synthase B